MITQREYSKLKGGQQRNYTLVRRSKEFHLTEINQYNNHNYDKVIIANHNLKEAYDLLKNLRSVDEKAYKELQQENTEKDKKIKEWKDKATNGYNKELESLFDTDKDHKEFQKDKKINSLEKVVKALRKENDDLKKEALVNKSKVREEFIEKLAQKDKDIKELSQQTEELEKWKTFVDEKDETIEYYKEEIDRLKGLCDTLPLLEQKFDWYKSVSEEDELCEDFNDAHRKIYTNSTIKEKGEYGEEYIKCYLKTEGFDVQERTHDNHDFILNGKEVEFKYSEGSSDQFWYINNVGYEKYYDRVMFCGRDDNGSKTILWFEREDFLELQPTYFTFNGDMIHGDLSNPRETHGKWNCEDIPKLMKDPKVHIGLEGW